MCERRELVVAIEVVDRDEQTLHVVAELTETTVAVEAKDSTHLAGGVIVVDVFVIDGSAGIR